MVAEPSDIACIPARNLPLARAFYEQKVGLKPKQAPRTYTSRYSCGRIDQHPAMSGPLRAAAFCTRMVSACCPGSA
jgi:hypothetical protein